MERPTNRNLKDKKVHNTTLLDILRNTYFVILIKQIILVLKKKKKKTRMEPLPFALVT